MNPCLVGGNGEGKSKLEACPNVAGSVRSGQSVSGTLLSPFLHTFLGPASPSCMSSRGGTRLTSSCLLCYHEAPAAPILLPLSFFLSLLFGGFSSSSSVVVVASLILHSAPSLPAPLLLRPASFSYPLFLLLLLLPGPRASKSPQLSPPVQGREKEGSSLRSLGFILDHLLLLLLRARASPMTTETPPEPSPLPLPLPLPAVAARRRRGRYK